MAQRENYSTVYEDDPLADAIRDYIATNPSPAELAAAMAQYGVTAEQISSATGYTTEQVNNYVAPAPVDNSAQEAAQAQAQAQAEAAAAAQWEAENAARWEAEQAQRWEAQQQAIRDQQAQEAQQAQQRAQQEQQRQAQEQAERAQIAAQREIQLQEERDAAEIRNRNNVVAGPVTPQVTDADILGWMNANPNASMEVLADTMRQAGVSSERLGQVTGKTLEDRIAATQTVAGPVVPPTNTQQTLSQDIAGPVAPPTTNTQQTQSGSALSNEQVDKMVRDAYAGIGRTGTGTGVSQIDQAGYDAFASALKTGTIAPADFNAKFQDAVKQYMIDNPTDPYSKYVGNYLVTNKKEDYVAGPTTSQVVAAIDKWSADNPNATTEQLAKAIDTGMGLTDTVKLALAQKYNIPTTDVVTVFNKALDPYAGVQINDYEGKSYDAKQLMNLASQIAGNLDTSKSGGGVFSTKGESVGFDYSTLTGTYGGKTFSSADQVAFDMARGLLQQGITDYSQVKNAKMGTIQEQTTNEDGSVSTYDRQAYINPVTGQELNTQIGYTATGKGGTEYYIDPATGKTFTKGISSSDLDGGLGIALSIGASFLLPGVGEILAAELGISATAGTALANAGLQLAMGADPKSVLLSAGLNVSGVGGDITDYLKGGIGDLVGTDFAGLTGSQLTKAIDTAAAAVTRAGTSFLTTGDAATALTAAAGSVVNSVVTDQTGSNVLGAGAAAYLQTGDLAASALVAADAAAFNAGKTFKKDVVDLFNGAKNTVMQNTVADNLTGSGITQAQLDDLFDPSKNPYLTSTELNTLAGITTGTVTDAGAGSVQQLAEGAKATYGSWQPMTDGEGQKRYVEVKNADGEVVDSFYETVDKSGAIGWQKTAENLEGSEKTIYVTAGKGKYPFEILTTSDSKEIGSPTSKAVKPTDFTIGGGTPGALTSNATGATATATSNNANVSTANTSTTSNTANTSTTSATSNNASVVGGNANVIVGGTTIGGTGSNTTGGNVTLGTGSGNIATVGGIGANGNITLSTGGGNGNVGNLGTGGNGNAIIGGTGGNGNANIGGVTGNGNVVISGTGGNGNITLGNVTTNANITTNTFSNLSNVVSNIFTDGNVITVLNTPNTVGNTLANTTTTINTGQGVNPIKLVSGGLNPGWIAPTEFYDTNSPVQSQFYWGQHPYQQGTTFNSALYNSVPNAPAKPWGIQQIAGVDPNTQLQYANNWFNPAAGALAPQAVQVASPRLTPISPYVVSGPITP